MTTPPASEPTPRVPTPLVPNWRAAVYAILTSLGLVLPWYFNLQHLAGGGTNAEFFSLGFANAVSSSFTVDLLVGALAFTLWIAVEGRRLCMRGWWLYPVLTFTVAFAFAGPLFLWMRERRLATMGGEMG